MELTNETLMQLIYNTPNDQELGSKLREWYWLKQEQEYNEA